MPVLLPIHIAGGGLAIVLGAVALLARKGRTLHRRVGLFFVYAMLTMGISGSILALRQSLTNANVIGGITTIYFVITALMTVRPATPWTRRLTIAAAFLGGGLAAYEIALSVKAYGLPRHMINGAPFFMLIFLATVTGLGSIGDVRVLRSGLPRGAKRLSRHLWRMCFALFIATASFFSIRARVARVLPEAFTTPLMRTAPILLVFVAMFYWLWRLRSRRPFTSPRDAVLSAEVSRTV
jgi:uncharacterized membrane protein